MSNPFVQRVANWLAQEVVVKGLAENKAFQRFALRTDHKLKEFTEKVDVTKVTEAANNLAKEASKAAESVSATVQREMQATPKPREIGFKSKQDLLRVALARVPRYCNDERRPPEAKVRRRRRQDHRIFIRLQKAFFCRSRVEPGADREVVRDREGLHGSPRRSRT